MNFVSIESADGKMLRRFVSSVLDEGTTAEDFFAAFAKNDPNYFSEAEEEIRFRLVADQDVVGFQLVDGKWQLQRMSIENALATEFGGDINDRGEVVRFFVPYSFQEATELVSDAAASAGFGIFYAAKGPFGATAPNQFLMERPVDGMIVQVSLAGTPRKPKILIRKE